jgi:hypothetical protein
VNYKKRGFLLKPEFALFDYNHNKLQSLEVISSIVFLISTGSSLVFLWDQLDRLFFLVHPNGYAGWAPELQLSGSNSNCPFIEVT